MARAALFVDAGYLLAGAHDLLGGTPSRSSFDCHYEALLPALRTFVNGHAGTLDFLRTYWYDGARDGIATSDHLRIGELPYVKVRLGRLNTRGQQKGVDGLIYRDLTTLARAGAIERAYIFTGDEDMRENVAAAQDLGLQVVLMCFQPTRQTGRSHALVREADEVIILEPDFWQPHFTRRTPPAAPSEAPSADAIAAAGRAFAESWAQSATPEETGELLARAPWMPRDLYVQLLLAAEVTLGSLRDYGEEKRALRAAFFATLGGETPANENDKEEASATAD